MHVSTGWIAAILWCCLGQVGAVEPISVEWVQKGGAMVPPSALQEGTAHRGEVAAWTRDLRAGLELELRDLNADGQLDVLAEMAHARGATGNRSYVVFLQNDHRYRYVGMTERIARTLTYVESQRTYLVQIADNGPGIDLSLWSLRTTGLSKVGRSLDLRAGDGGSVQDRELYRDLTARIMPENRLLALFAPPLPDGSGFVDPTGMAPAWDNPNGWSASEVRITEGVIQATITSKEPLSGLPSIRAGDAYESRFSGQLLHLRGNSAVVLLPDEPERFSTAHLFLVFYRQDDSVRFVFSGNLLGAENQ